MVVITGLAGCSRFCVQNASTQTSTRSFLFHSDTLSSAELGDRRGNWTFSNGSIHNKQPHRAKLMQTRCKTPFPSLKYGNRNTGEKAV